jgi:hypothetical protein
MICGNPAVTCPAGVCEYHDLFDLTKTVPGINAADYPQDCQDVADCLPVFEGPLACCDLTCPNAAINVSAQDQLQRDLDRLTPVCSSVSCRKLPPNAGQPSGCHGRVACENGRCTILTTTP